MNRNIIEKKMTNTVKEDINTLKIKDFIKTIKQARNYLHSDNKELSKSAAKVMDLQQVATKMWRNSELKMRIYDDDATIKRDLNKWKNIAKLYNCPETLLKSFPHLTSQEKEDIISVTEPVFTDFLSNIPDKKLLKGLVIFSSLIKTYHSQNFKQVAACSHHAKIRQAYERNTPSYSG